MPLSTHWGKNATPKLLRSFNDVRLKDAILVSHVDKVISYSSISMIGKNATPKLLRSSNYHLKIPETLKQLAPSDPSWVRLGNLVLMLLKTVNYVRFKDAILVSHVDKVISYSSISTIGKECDS
ncbi:hypothetical protein PoB_005581700 [Plakobranchus ocellatus]|uniref:Uncharacterized protein n=1 Tax=Plakobranchus ocellatus TaxID=259542 RepID=A0AAV4CDP4_9GAST|nr:hypothetical protein PoB_005581700 [Plakobranchus ocellatus]